MRLIPGFVFVSAFVFGLASAWSQTALEKPVKYRLYARDAQDKCTVAFEAAGTGANDSLILEVSGNGELKSRQAKADVNGKVAFSAILAAGLVDYRFALLARKGTASVQVEKVDSVACGDAYLIYGQSNAEALYGTGEYPYRNGWIRTYRRGWSSPGSQDIGVWGQHLARQIVEKRRMPVCIINGAKGNTSIADLGPDFVVPAANADWTNDTKPYGNFYKRLAGWAKEAGLAGSVKALIWHQGEKQVYDAKNNNPANYPSEFLELRKSFYSDFPGIKKLFMFQIKTGCGGGSLGWSVLFEAQRKLAADLADLEIMSTLAPDIVSCHYGEDGLPGYLTIAEWIHPMLDSAFYGGRYTYPLAPPNLLQAAYTGKPKDEVVLVFDQEVKWNDSTAFDPKNGAHLQYYGATGTNRPTTYLKALFAMDSLITGQVASGRSEGNKVFLKLKSANAAFKKLAYPHGNLNGGYPGPYITGGKNGLGTLGFYVPIDSVFAPTGNFAEAAKAPDAHATIRVRRWPGGKVTLEVPQGLFRGTGDIHLEIRNLAGALVRRQSGRRSPLAGPVTLELDGLPEGLFLCILRDGKRVVGAPITLLAPAVGP